MIGYDIAKKAIGNYIDHIEFPPLEEEQDFIKACDACWAAKDLLLYLEEHWNENFYFELISDYIEDCRYRAEKYKNDIMGPKYQIAKETAEEILLYFI